MSKMPDKIWLHKDTKYNTGNVVCGYQYKFALEIEVEGIENFVEYVPKNAFIEKACKWLEDNYPYYFEHTSIESELTFGEEFRKAMEE